MPPKKDAADGKTKKAKKIKDPNAPKRPMTAYFLFKGEKRAEVKKSNPDIKVQDIAKVGSIVTVATGLLLIKIITYDRVLKL